VCVCVCVCVGARRCVRRTPIRACVITGVRTRVRDSVEVGAVSLGININA
jgi:hypothetical protein